MHLPRNRANFGFAALVSRFRRSYPFAARAHGRNVKSATLACLFVLFVFDHRALTDLLQILLRFLLVALGRDALAGLALARRVFRRRFLLGADREHLDAVFGDLGRGQPADFDAVQHLAQLGRNVGGAADDLVAYRDVLERAGEVDAFIATLEAAAQGLRLALAPVDECFRRPGRDQEQDRTQGVVVADGIVGLRFHFLEDV